MTAAQKWLEGIPATEEFLRANNIESREEPTAATYFVYFSDGSCCKWNSAAKCWELS